MNLDDNAPFLLDKNVFYSAGVEEDVIQAWSSGRKLGGWPIDMNLFT